MKHRLGISLGLVLLGIGAAPFWMGKSATIAHPAKETVLAWTTESRAILVASAADDYIPPLLGITDDDLIDNPRINPVLALTGADDDDEPGRLTFLADYVPRLPLPPGLLLVSGYDVPRLTPFPNPGSLSTGINLFGASQVDSTGGPSVESPNHVQNPPAVRPDLGYAPPAPASINPATQLNYPRPMPGLAQPMPSPQGAVAPPPATNVPPGVAATPPPFAPSPPPGMDLAGLVMDLLDLAGSLPTRFLIPICLPTPERTWLLAQASLRPTRLVKFLTVRNPTLGLLTRHRAPTAMAGVVIVRTSKVLAPHIRNTDMATPGTLAMADFREACSRLAMAVALVDQWDLEPRVLAAANRAAVNPVLAVACQPQAAACRALVVK